MSMSTHVIGLKPPDAKWRKMKQAWDACKEAGVDPPDTVEDFFGPDGPDEGGVRVELEDHACYKEYQSDMEVGLEIDVTKLPPDVKVIRFFNSY